MATLLYNSRPSLRPSRALSTMLADMLRDPQPAGAQPAATFAPATDILETATGFELHLAMPGVKKEAIHLDFIDGHLVVSGNRHNPTAATPEATSNENTDAQTSETPTTARFRRTETSYGAFRRSFRLPETVSVKAIDAELSDGILRVMLPFDTDKVTTQHIEIR